ncbi:MAG TPA: CopG family transcriptional regulator [Thermoanaerobaculia bacterium]|nr:CopG family transcriptional regulator [Thermoanaerobaculia bacterium]
MRKTTVYLPDSLKASLERMAAEERRSEAELIREAIAAKVESRPRPRPRVPLRQEGLGDPTAADRVDQLLDGFGYR